MWHNRLGMDGICNNRRGERCGEVGYVRGALQECKVGRYG